MESFFSLLKTKRIARQTAIRYRCTDRGARLVSIPGPEVLIESSNKPKTEALLKMRWPGIWMRCRRISRRR
jgi:hypothetical protein